MFAAEATTPTLAARAGAQIADGGAADLLRPTRSWLRRAAASGRRKDADPRGGLDAISGVRPVEGDSLKGRVTPRGRPVPRTT